jgi:glycosyltransferase involved in cell wall biosynthesis
VIGAVGVVVPAVNEQATIGACLHSLAWARNRLGAVAARRVGVRIVVVLDGCIDETAAIVQRHAGVESVACSVGGVGAARSLGVQRLLASTAVPLQQLWLANTDADSIVPPDWLAAQVEEADRGAHLVLGTVRPEPGLAAETEQAWFAQHRLREGHPHVHGANLGIRADVYTALGGWPARSTGEDLALAERAAATGHLEIVRTARIPVCTSARLHGRAPHGFAAYLRGLTAATDDVAV